MKNILLQVPSRVLENNEIFINKTNDNNRVWCDLKKQLYHLGYNLITADRNTLDSCERIIFLDSLSLDGLKINQGGTTATIKKFFGIKTPRPWPNRNLYQEAIEKGMKEKLLLLLWEGKAVNPYNYQKETWDKFNSIMTWDEDLIDNKKFFKFYLPVPEHKSPSKKYTFSEKKLLVNISINKKSSYQEELYSERRKSILYFDLHFPKDFDLYGLRWNQPITFTEKLFPFITPRYKTYGGIIDDKTEIMAKYKFALCYENMKNKNGYITEKIFDALFSKTVPVYWGAGDIDKFVDSNSFIDRRNFHNNEELANYLTNIKEEEYNKMILAGEAYLASDKFKLFQSDFFCKNIIEKLHLVPC